MLEAEQQFRRIIGYRDLAKLVVTIEHGPPSAGRPDPEQGARHRPHRLTITPGPPPRKSTATGTSSARYSLHEQPARTFVVMTGATGGGKSTLARAGQAALGPAYAGALADGAITPQRGGRGANQATPDMETVMAPRRVAFSPEVENLRPDPTRLKALTGGDLQAWRPLYGHPRSGVPTASVWLLGNKPPQGLGLTDPAMLERVRAVPYRRYPKTSGTPAWSKRSTAPVQKPANAARRSQPSSSRGRQHSRRAARPSPPWRSSKPSTPSATTTSAPSAAG